MIRIYRVKMTDLLASYISCKFSFMLLALQCEILQLAINFQVEII